jgi:hypothetical protein
VTSRTLGVLVAVAVVAGAVIAAVGLATRGGSRHAPSVLVDEQRGRIGRVVLGETRADVLAVLGPSGGDARGSVQRYEHLVVRLARGRVASITTTDVSTRTLRAVRVGQPLSAARASYRRAASCFGLPSGELQTGGKPESAYCNVKVPAGRLRFERDPIASITLSARPSS